FGEALNAELETPITSTLQAAGENMLSEIGFQPVGSSPEGHDDPWKYPPKKVLEYLASRTQPIRDSGETIRNRLNTSLVEGVTNGETHLQLAGRVKAVFTDLADSEAKVIARTEVNSAS
ncbi:MAG TPA: hypothetical protein DCQ92_17305, partial [Verrucomicrobia subdivision 3 bacterium]|nr:hypothetical protein [Limisphaerales bacterium]